MINTVCNDPCDITALFTYCYLTSFCFTVTSVGTHCKLDLARTGSTLGSIQSAEPDCYIQLEFNLASCSSSSSIHIQNLEYRAVNTQAKKLTILIYKKR